VRDVAVVGHDRLQTGIKTVRNSAANRVLDFNPSGSHTTTPADSGSTWRGRPGRAGWRCRVSWMPRLPAWHGRRRVPRRRQKTIDGAESDPAPQVPVATASISRLRRVLRRPYLPRDVAWLRATVPSSDSPGRTRVNATGTNSSVGPSTVKRTREKADVARSLVCG